MFSTGTFNAIKLKSQLKMASSQIQIASNRKTSLLKQSMREIAMFLNEDPPKEEKARLRAEAFIHDDNIIQAYDILNLQCNLLVERVKLIEQSKNKKCPSDLLSCVATLIYAEPFVDIKEFSLIRKQLCAKYGKYFEEDALANKRSIVNEKIALLLSAYPPEPHVVQNYMIRICKQYEVDWKPISMIAQPPSSNPPPPSSSLSPSSIPTLAVRAMSIKQDGAGTRKSDWVNEYEFYDIQTVDGVVPATVDGSQSRQNQGGLDNKVVPTTSETIVEAILVGEQPMPNAQNSFAHKSITYAEQSSINNNGEEDFVYLEHPPPATAPIENKPTSKLSMLESSKVQQQESENIASTERSASSSTFQNNISNASKNASRETILIKKKDSPAAYTNTASHEKKQISLQERLDTLQKDHKEREEKITNTGVCSKELKTNHLDDKIDKMLDNSVEHKEAIEVQDSERENIISELIKREEGRRVAEEKEVKENDAGEGQEEESATEIPDRENKNLSLEQLNNSNRTDSNEQSIVEKSEVEEIKKITPSDHSFVDKRSPQETCVILGKEQYSPNSQSETFPISSTIESDLDNDPQKRQLESQESISTININQHSIEALAREVDISVSPIKETATMSVEAPTASTILPVKPIEIAANTEEETKTSSNRDKEDKKTRHILAAAAGVAGGLAGLAAPVVATGVFVGVGSALIAQKVGKKIQKKQRKNQDQSIKRNYSQGKASIAGNEILGKIKTIANTIY